MGRGLSLRRVRSVEDIGARRWCKWLNDRAVSHHLESGGHWTPARLRLWFAAHTERGQRLYAITVAGKPIGTLKLEDLQKSWAMLGLMIGERGAWGRGFGTEAIRRGCQLAKRAGVVGVWAGMREENHGARSAFLKNGFRVPNEALRKWPDEILKTIARWVPGPARIVLMRRF